jgi:serine/threonine-protein kinase
VADTSALEPGTFVAERYRVVEKIGHGGMGAVYVVQHVHTDEKLALKVLHPSVLRDASAVERFRREARAPARITSEHVARVTDADTAADLDGAPFYVMELLRGRDLERVLREDGPIPPAQVVEYLRQAARALDKAHAIGIIHRDLKPENLFLTEREDGSPCIKLLDFGIARIGDDGTTQPDGKLTTQVGYVIGTPNYMAPEQTMGNPELIGAATDVWALGLLAFKLLVGHEFFQGTTTAALYAEILASPIPTPTDRGSGLGPAFDEWFAGCVARPVEKRFSSAGVAVTGLADAFGIALPLRASSESFPDLPRMVTPSSASMAVAPAGADPTAAPAPATPDAPADVPAAVSAEAVAPKRTGGAAPLVALAVAAVVLLGLAVAAALGLFSRKPPEGLVATPASATTVTATSASAAATEVAPETSASAVVPVHTGEPARPRTSGAATSTAKAASTAGGHKDSKEDHALSATQKKRLDSLQRLCSQGTYSPAECAAKRQAIIHGGP